MKEREELELILKLIGKFNLPLSPILEYAIKEKMEEYPNASEGLNKEEEINENNSDEEEINYQKEKDKEFSESKDFIVENKGNCGYIVDNYGIRVYSSRGKMIKKDGFFYRLNYTYSLFSINIVKQNERGFFVLDKKIISASYRSPLFVALSENRYDEQIKAVKYENDTGEYSILVGDRWYGYAGHYADLESPKDTSSRHIQTSNTDLKKTQARGSKKNLVIHDYKDKSIAVTGKTVQYKRELKALGGFFVAWTNFGPAWIFSSKKRAEIQSFIDGNDYNVNSLEDEDSEKALNGNTSRYVIRVKYPNGSVFCSNLVWETLVDVINYASPIKVNNLNIMCAGDNLVTQELNKNSVYRAAQKDIGRGYYVNTYSSTDTKYRQIERINQELDLGLIVEKVTIDRKGNVQLVKEDNPSIYDKQKQDSLQASIVQEPPKDKRIGYTIRLFPSQLIGEIARVRVDSKGIKKLIVKTSKNDFVEINDLPYLYEVLKRK